MRERLVSDATLIGRDRALAAGAAAAALAVYVLSLAPGLIAITDTPKFQFIGRILGVAHPPGYPLYVLVSHVFGLVPIGSLAYRINLMSAICGALACGAMFLAMRLLGVGRLVAGTAALAAAFGSTVWYVSTIAEVYALNAVLVAAAMVALLLWQQSRRGSWFFAAVALVGVSLGNHTTTVFLIPAIAAFAIGESPRFALHPRTIALSAAIVAAALLQYLFVLVRSLGGAWVESPVSNLSELIGVMAGSDYFRGVMPQGLGTSLTRLVPIVWQMFERELSPAGLALTALGAAVLWRRSKPALALLLVAAFEYAAFCAVYTPKEFEVFLVPAFLACWALAAVGAQWLVERARARGRRRTVAALALVLTVAPALQLARNYDARDLSHARADMRFFDALFERIPEGSALLHEDFLVDRMVYYKTLGEQVTRGRRVLALVPAEIGPVRRTWHDGYGLFAFPVTAKTMRLLDGADFSYAPLDLANGTLARYLDDLPRRTVVAVGVPGRHLGSFARARRLPLGAIGFTRRLTPLDAAGGLAIIGARGGSAAEDVPDRSGVSVRLVPSDSTIGPAPAWPIVVRADRNVATIELGGREILRTGVGMAVAIWTGGQLTAAFVLSSDAPSPPTLPTPYAVYPLRGLRERQTIGAAPIDLTPATAGGVFVFTTVSGASRFVTYAGRERPLAPALLDCSARSWPAPSVRAFTGPHATSGELARALAEDALPFDSRLKNSRHVYRIAFETTWSAPGGVLVGLGGVPDVAYGRLLDGAPSLIYGLDLATHLARIDTRTLALHMARDHHEQLVGAGWSTVQFDGVAPYRETADREAELLLPIAEPQDVRLGIQLIGLPRAGSPPGLVGIRVNEQSLPPIVPTSEWRRYWQDVPASFLKKGVNSLVFEISPETTHMAVSDVLIESKSPTLTPL